MKMLTPFVVGVLVVILGYALWVGLIEDSFTKGTVPDQDGQDQQEGSNNAADQGGKGAFQNNPDEIPAWLNAGPISLPDTRTKRVDGLPNVIGELEFMTFGRDKHAINSVALKIKLDELRRAMAQMSREEEDKLAEYFRQCKDPAMKYYLMASFRSWGGEPYVNAIAEYYEAEPDMVAESLQHLMGRTKVAVEAMEGLIQNEIDPMRRAKLVARAGFLGAPGTETMMKRFFSKRNSVDRRQSIPALAKSQDQEGHQLLFELIEGDYEGARYLPQESGPATEEFKDLRCHAVLALLQNGNDSEVERLLERAMQSEDDDAVAGYVEKFFPAVNHGRFVGKVADHIKDSGKASQSLALYINRRASIHDIPKLQSLLELDIDRRSRDMIRETINKLR